MDIIFDFNNAVLTYLLSEDPDERFAEHYPIGSYVLNTTSRTPVKIQTTNNTIIAIIGFCFDSHGELNVTQIPSFLLSRQDLTIIDVFRRSTRLAGHYIIIILGEFGEYIIGDATCSVPINYDLGSVCISSVDKLIADKKKYSYSPVSLDVRKKSTSLIQQLPVNLTMYDNIKALLPNHYYDVCKKEAVRVPFNICVSDDPQECSSIITTSISLIDNVVRQYSNQFPLLCPLTSGYDSRVVLSFLRKNNPEIGCYTSKLPALSLDSADILVPHKICSKINIEHHVLDWMNAPEDYVNNVKSVLGEYISIETINECYTNIYNHGNRCIVNGNIIGQIGKSSLFNSIPLLFANSSLYQCKLHNKSVYSQKLLQQYRINQKKDKTDAFDLFALENRCGRWASQGTTIFNICGFYTLNIFNCLEIIQSWMRIPRLKRKNNYVHLKYLQNNDLDLLSFSFGESSFFNIVKTNWPSFLAASYIKQYM